MYLQVCCFLFTLMLVILKFYQICTNKFCKSRKRLDGKTCIVTGGTLGMGLEIAKELARRGARVIVACPFIEEGYAAQKTIVKETGNGNVEFRHLDLASLKCTRKFALDILRTEHRLDILINNAGLTAQNITTEDGLNITMQVNYFGHFLLTILLLPLLKKTGTAKEKSRIVNTSSILHRFGSVKYTEEYYEVYPNSKLCITVFSMELAKRLKGNNVVINSVDPGLVGTTIFTTNRFSYYAQLLEFIFRNFFKSPLEGAQTALHVALSEELGDVSGEYFRNCKFSKAIPKAYDYTVAKLLWDESIRLVKLNDFELDI